MEQRTRESKRSWRPRGTHAALLQASEEGGRVSEAPEEPRRATLRGCIEEAWEGGSPDWSRAVEALSSGEPLRLTDDEPGVVLAEQLARVGSPSELLPILERVHPKTRTLILDQWSELLEAIPLGPKPRSEDYEAAARAYIALRALRVVELLEEHFLEGGEDPRNRGDLYLARNDRYYFNFTYLCGDFELSREEAIGALGALGKAISPSSADYERLGSREEFAELIESLAPIEGDAIPGALRELLPLVDVAFNRVTEHLPRRLISHLTVAAVARRLGFELSGRELLELYELQVARQALEDDARLLEHLHNLHAFEPEAGEQVRGPSLAWREHWAGLSEALGEVRLVELTRRILEVHARFAQMLDEPPAYRLSLAWQAISLDSEALAERIVEMTTADGEQAPVIAGALLHEDVPPQMLRRLAKLWRARAEEVPEQSGWSRDFTVLVLRHLITRQRRWLIERLTDLYLRGGGYEAGETRELIEVVLERLLDEMALSTREGKRLDEASLHYRLIPEDANVFTGEIVDASRWASPTSAYKYVRTLLRLEDRGLDYLASLVSERRVITIDKALRKLDFHTSVQQIVSAVEAYDAAPEQALALLLELRDSEGERPEGAWLERMGALLEGLGRRPACDLLWRLYRWDMGDIHSLNPGLFWALRLVPIQGSVTRLARAATEMVRRKPSFAVAALDTLDAIATRGALSAILQMRRRIRNRKVLRLINSTIDRIAEEDGLDRDVFLDYAVDTGDLEPDGSRLFDFGSHQVTLRLEPDGRISTTVLDARGRRLRSFPKTAKDADPKLYKTFQATKKLLVETLSYQSRRLEQAMINMRAWRGRDFLEIFCEHPVMAHLARRLLWARQEAGGEPGEAFLPGAEGLIDVRGGAVALDEDDAVIIVHPHYIGDAALEAWRARLEAAEIEQPFAQLHRETWRPSDEERAANTPRRLIDTTSESQSLYRVVKERGWSTDGGGPWEVGMTTHSYRHYPVSDQMVHLDTDQLGYDKVLKVVAVRFTAVDEEAALTLEDVHPIVYSEAYRDLMLSVEVVD